MDKLCKIRDLYRAVTDFESEFEDEYHIGLNEGMLLCTLAKKENLSSGDIADKLGLRSSNTSKVIKSVEEKGLITRVVGEVDKRQMYFSLTTKGKDVLQLIECDKIELPDLLERILVR